MFVKKRMVTLGLLTYLCFQLPTADKVTNWATNCNFGHSSSNHRKEKKKLCPFTGALSQTISFWTYWSNLRVIQCDCTALIHQIFTFRATNIKFNSVSLQNFVLLLKPCIVTVFFCGSVWLPFFGKLLNSTRSL